MSRRSKQPIRLGPAAIRRSGTAGAGEWVERQGERFYRIAGYDGLPPFLMSVVSGHDHWSFVSSTGGLTCGRRDPENALFPYCTDDKVHDACATTGPLSVLRVSRDGETKLWQPFDRGPAVYDLERNLYKNVHGNKLAFEEVNRDLGLTFEFTWTSGDRYGFVRNARLSNAGAEVEVELLDGLRNLLPYGVDRAMQSRFSTLVDAYKRAEAVRGTHAGIYSLSSIPTDRAEPSEALKATVVWSTGLDGGRLLLSEDQLGAFRSGGDVDPETLVKGKRGAFFVHANLTLPQGAERSWYVVADVEQGPARVAELLYEIRTGVLTGALERDVAEGTARLQRLVGSADGFQQTSDDRATARHFANTLSNVMRGGVFPHGYRFPRADFVDFVRRRHRPLGDTVEAALNDLDGPLTRDTALKLAEGSRDETLIRLVHEYLPLAFSRRHGDPSRPWNHFSIRLRAADGTERLDYQGNWRDIFQNWEALALSFPEYIESFIATFVNASTADGHNPYRISKDGIDWEVLEPDNPWSNIGYWGDHQIVYLLRLLELSLRHHPGLLAEWLSRDLFVYADVPYRIKRYRDLLADPRNTVEYDTERARDVARRVDTVGADGKLVALQSGSIYRVNLLEKLLVAALARTGNLVPGGGIWMNTQRPEWNDANNALVGFGLSMVTLCYLRRYLHLLQELLDATAATTFAVSRELAAFFEAVETVLRDHEVLLEGPVSNACRRSFMDGMGAANDGYRDAVYRGLSGDKVPLARLDLQAFAGLALGFLDHAIEQNRRGDGLFHAYNLLSFGTDGFAVEPLDEMLEGQVAVLGSGYLDGVASLELLESLRQSRLYREDQRSYLLYPDRELPGFLEKNVIPEPLVESHTWIGEQLDAGRADYVERDVDGNVHFNGIFRNAAELRAALERDPAVGPRDANKLCEVWEAVFGHRRFTGRSGSMFKYEGLGCIYWHMVSKLALATAETAASSAERGGDPATAGRLVDRYREIREGLGVHKTPAEYGAFPFEPYSHTPGFAGVQQPGLTGQVKEDVIARFLELGVRVVDGALAFDPSLLDRAEFLDRPTNWVYTTGGEPQTEELPAGSLAFTVCGVPVVYRLADTSGLEIVDREGGTKTLTGRRLTPELSRALFRRDGSVRKLVVHLPEEALDSRGAS